MRLRAFCTQASYLINKLVNSLRELLIALFVFMILSQAINWLRRPEPQSRELPLAELMSEILNRPRNLHHSKSRATIIYLWGSWCSVCEWVSPMISDLAAERDDLRVITIAVHSGSNQRLRNYLRKKELSFPVINDSHDRWRSYFGASVYPSLFIYDGQGYVQIIETGLMTHVGLSLRLWWVLRHT